MQGIKLALSVFVLLLGVAAVPGLAEPATLEGYLMPVACKDRKTGTGPDHTTACALEPECMETGFGLWTAEDFTKFDSHGNELALNYFRTTERKDHHRVRVIGQLDGEILKVQELVAVKE